MMIVLCLAVLFIGLLVLGLCKVSGQCSRWEDDLAPREDG